MATLIVTGKTYPHREALRKLGFKWTAGPKEWRLSRTAISTANAIIDNLGTPKDLIFELVADGNEQIPLDWRQRDDNIGVCEPKWNADSKGRWEESNPSPIQRGASSDCDEDVVRESVDWSKISKTLNNVTSKKSKGGRRSGSRKYVSKRRKAELSNQYAQIKHNERSIAKNLSKKKSHASEEGSDKFYTPTGGNMSAPKPYARFVEEPLGTREDHKRERGRNWSESRKPK
jgi:hypothetical protein